MHKLLIDPRRIARTDVGAERLAKLALGRLPSTSGECGAPERRGDIGARGRVWV